MNTPHASQWDAFGDFGSPSSPGHRSGLSDGDLAAARASEIGLRADGRAGRLLAEIESYLEFFAIARAA